MKDINARTVVRCWSDTEVPDDLVKTTHLNKKIQVIPVTEMNCDSKQRNPSLAAAHDCEPTKMIITLGKRSGSAILRSYFNASYVSGKLMYSTFRDFLDRTNSRGIRLRTAHMQISVVGDVVRVLKSFTVIWILSVVQTLIFSNYIFFINHQFINCIEQIRYNNFNSCSTYSQCLAWIIYHLCLKLLQLQTVD